MLVINCNNILKFEKIFKELFSTLRMDIPTKIVHRVIKPCKKNKF